MKKNTVYASYKNYMVSFDPDTCTAELINDVHGTRMTMKLMKFGQMTSALLPKEL